MEILCIILLIIGCYSVIIGVNNYRKTHHSQLAQAKKTYIIRHLIYILLLFIFQILPQFNSQFHSSYYYHNNNNNNIDFICFMLTISSGLIMSLFRISEN